MKVLNVFVVLFMIVKCFLMFSMAMMSSFQKTYSTPQTLDDDAQSDLMAQFPARILGNASQNGLKGFVFQ